MNCDWWDISVNGKLLVTIKGKSTAEFFYKYLSKDSSYHYDVRYSKKNKEQEREREEEQPLSPRDLSVGISD
jgi:hypothetical protein